MLEITVAVFRRTVHHVVNSAAVAAGRLIFHVDDGISENQRPNQSVDRLGGQHHDQRRQEQLPHVDWI